jgi:hydrogenase/urease accessory protein HupE
MMRRAVLLIAFGAWLVAPVGAWAHPLAPAVLSLAPGPDEGTIIMTWRAPVKRPKGQALEPRVPGGCVPLGPTKHQLSEDRAAVVETRLLRCQPPDLVGSKVRIEGLSGSTVNVVVRVARPDGSFDHSIIDARNPSLTIAAPEEETHSFFDYLALGVEHLVTGWDHLTFVIGLLILFGWHRRLIAAVTAFTLGHSLTLALSIFGVVTVPQVLVEALIAMTIVVLALEIQSGGRGPVWKHPWSAPAALGLLHGLGFASVLFDAGLPGDEIPLALFGFNLGLEVGQLGIIACAWLTYLAFRGFMPMAWREDRMLPAYVIGSLAAFWVIERTVAAFST